MISRKIPPIGFNFLGYVTLKNICLSPTSKILIVDSM